MIHMLRPEALTIVWIYLCAVECSDGVFRERSGEFSSVDFPSPYPKSSACSYRIEVDPGFKLLLQFDPRFEVEDHPDISCPYDHLKVRTAHTLPYTHICSGHLSLSDHNRKQGVWSILW